MNEKSGVSTARNTPTLGRELEGLFMGPIKEHAKELADVLRKEFGEPISCTPVDMPISDALTFRRLNKLTPTLQSCTFKVFEEFGEIARNLGKYLRLSGERTEDMDHAEWVYSTIGEALDGIQSLTTLVFLLADENNVDIAGEIGRHEAKLVAKGYLVDNEPLIPKTVRIDPTWMVCENCPNQKTGNDIPPKCEACEDSEWGRPSNFVRKKEKS